MADVVFTKEELVNILRRLSLDKYSSTFFAPNGGYCLCNAQGRNKGHSKQRKKTENS